MIRIIFSAGLLLCAGSGFAAYTQLNPGTSVGNMPQAAMQYLADTPARLKVLMAGEEPEPARPRIAQLPQTRGVNTRGNTSLAERKMRATARSMVNAAPAARAQRDANRDRAQQRKWSLFSRKAPQEKAQGGRLDAVQSRARARAVEEARWNDMLKAGGYTGPRLRLDQLRD